MSKKFLYIFILVFLTSCSSLKKENSKNVKLIDIFKESEPIKKEFNSNLLIKKNFIYKNKPFINNNTNNNGNINFDTNFEKISNFKFTKIKKFDSNQPELFFTNKNEIIFFMGKVQFLN